jgi:hypothetical protein
MKKTFRARRKNAPHGRFAVHHSRKGYVTIALTSGLQGPATPTVLTQRRW